MSVVTVAERLAAIQADIAGITTAFDIDEIPNVIHSANLPCFINVPGEAAYTRISEDMWSETRTWYLLLYIAPIARPFEVAQRMALATPFFDLVRQAFAARPTLESLPYVADALLIADSGVVLPLQYGSSQGQPALFTAIEFRLQVTELVGDVAPVDY